MSDIIDSFALGGDKPAAGNTGGDPIFALIAEERRLRQIGNDFRKRADLPLFALGDSNERRRRFGDLEEEALPAPFGPLYAEAQRYEELAGELFDRVASTKATTIEGIMAQIWFLWPGAEIDDNAELVIAGLRDIAAKGGAA